MQQIVIYFFVRKRKERSGNAAERKMREVKKERTHEWERNENIRITAANIVLQKMASTASLGLFFLLHVHLLQCSRTFILHVLHQYVVHLRISHIVLDRSSSILLREAHSSLRQVAYYPPHFLLLLVRQSF